MSFEHPKEILSMYPGESVLLEKFLERNVSIKNILSDNSRKQEVAPWYVENRLEQNMKEVFGRIVQTLSIDRTREQDPNSRTSSWEDDIDIFVREKVS